MPDDQPNNAPDSVPPVPNDRDDAASVLTRADRNDAPGGGGLMGSGAGSAAMKGGAATPNSPIDAGIASDGDAESEARLRSIAADSARPR